MIEAPDKRPLCVDLDRTLIRSDLLLESVLSLLRRQPWQLVRAPFWRFRGRAAIERGVALRAEIDASRLPYRTELLAWLREERRAGRRLVLVTASEERLAVAVAKHLGIFDEILASDGRGNLEGPRRAARLRERFGAGGYDYAGSARADLASWSGAHEAVLVGASPAVLARARECANVVRIVAPRRGGRLGVLLHATRIHQCVKNVLVFVPVVGAHRLGEPAEMVRCLLAFLAFSLGASASYMLNDLVDLEHDRGHPTKRDRPFAAGTLRLDVAFALIPAFLLASAGVAASLSTAFVGMLGLYLATTTAYSFFLKHVMILDVIVLAMLYTIRILAGGVAAGVQVSNWLLIFSIFFFLSLAFVKRTVELRPLRSATDGGEVAGRGYAAQDLEQVASLGSASGYIAVVVFSLYVSSSDVARLYRHPEYLWLICPLLLYWLSRLWLLARRGRLDSDPVLFAVKDPASYVVGVIAAAILIVAT
ncbi:MAG TPA: UbiA family prenyltransferase [Deltaproteobacteria bacterium]|jgi:4-hydroxybenzoate polyprenyltransferase|nr:UbiA family prenyltransferase [Deltaproteobacteria bacterium]